MTDNTITRIAETIRQHYYQRAWLGDGCGCNQWRGEFMDWHQHVAEQIFLQLETNGDDKTTTGAGPTAVEEGQGSR